MRTLELYGLAAYYDVGSATSLQNDFGIGKSALATWEIE